MSVNRVLKRLVRDLHILAIPQPRDQQYLYMPNPAKINRRSSKIDHALAMVDFFIYTGTPQTFIIEPDLKHSYHPDIYYKDIDSNEAYIVEIQLSKVSNKVMQEKANGFIDSYRKKKHDAKTLIIVSDIEYTINVPESYRLVFISASAVQEVTQYV